NCLRGSCRIVRERWIVTLHRSMQRAVWRRTTVALLRRRLTARVCAVSAIARHAPHEQSSDPCEFRDRERRQDQHGKTNQELPMRSPSIIPPQPGDEWIPGVAHSSILSRRTGGEDKNRTFLPRPPP